MPGNTPYESRSVQIYMERNGVINYVYDSETSQVLKGVTNMGMPNAVLELKGAQYGWDLEPYNTHGVDISTMYEDTQHVAANVQADKQHRNTLGVRTPELVKLDCGHWGAYKRWREFPNGDSDGIKLGRQREFGVIEGTNVWLCKFVATTGLAGSKQHTAAKLQPIACPIFKLLVAEVEANGCAIEVLNHTIATHATGGLNANNLKVIFPDMHLPERWPDLPLDADRYAGEGKYQASTVDTAIKELQKRLRECQRDPSGWVKGSPLSAEEQHEIQKYIEKIDAMPQITKDQIHQLSVAGQSHPDQFVFTTGLVFKDTHRFSPTMFEAEKNIVDREFRLRSTWFYARGPKWSEEPDAGSEDWFESIRKNGNGDATPAVDMVLLLLSLEGTRGKLAGNQSLSVYQVGDIFEAWVNREFLYAGMEITDRNAGDADTLGKIRYLSSGVSPTAPKDELQPRMDRGWRRKAADLGFNDPALSIPVASKRYAFHLWKREEMLYRYKLGTQFHPPKSNQEFDTHFKFTPGETQRRQDLLADRIHIVLDHQLPIPKQGNHDYSLVAKVFELDGNLDGAPYRTTNRRGDTEYKWNRMIIDLMFNRLNTRCLYGNHDGYRGDTLLNAGIGNAQCPGYITEPGIWFEHSHRWDAYNRDGCAFGAGAANLTYYWFNNMCSKTGGKAENAFAQQEQTSFIPGAGLWFMLVNFGANGDWIEQAGIRNTVQPFGIYVNGHTHSGSLVRVQFRLNLSTQASAAASQKKDAVIEKATQAKDAVGEKATQFSNFVKSYIP